MNFSNIKQIAYQESRNAFRTKVVYISAIVLSVALLSALFISWQNAKTLNAEREKYQELVRSNWLEQPDRHPHRSSHYGYLAFRPKSHLKYLDSVRTHHTNIREYFYPFIFKNSKVEEINWQNLPKHEFEDKKQPTKFPNSILAILAFTLIFGGLAWRKLREILR